MTDVTNTIEDILETLMGFTALSSSAFKIEPTDSSVFFSIAKQVVKNVPLTDRQYELVFNKLSMAYYRKQFVSNGIADQDYEAALEQTRYPLREIDRSKYVTLVDRPPESVIKHRNKHAVESPSQWIKIGFPFSKKLIVSIDKLTNKTAYYIHGTEGTDTRDHYFKCDEEIVYHIVEEFKDKEFEIDQELLDLHKSLEKFNNCESEFLPLVREGTLEHFHPTTEQHLLDTIGTPSVGNIVRYQDSSLMFDIRHIDEDLLTQAIKQVTPLTAGVVNRVSPTILVQPTTWGVDAIVETLDELKRFPLLVIVGPEDALDNLKNVYDALKGYVTSSEISVLFRLDNDTNAKFNDFVKDQGLNSPVNEYTEVVVISKDKLPKPLLKAGWFPRSVLRIGSNRVQVKIDQWINECDLVIHYDSVATPWQPSQVKRRKVETI